MTNHNNGSPVKPVSSVYQDDELEKDKIALSGGDSAGEDSVLGSASADDLGDIDDNDPDAGGVMDIDAARRVMGESNDGNGEFRNELSDEDLNLNNSDEVNTIDPTDPRELEEPF